MKKEIFHFIGIGGVSMSGLAKILHYTSSAVQGSDKCKSVFTKSLTKLGIKVFHNHHSSYVKNATTVVYNCAISQDNPELVFAKQNKLKILTRGQLLGKISKKYKNVIAVSGAHGKTTTTAMIGEIFDLAGLNPTIHCGGIMDKYNSSIKLGACDYFITEACEYKDSFLSLKPSVGVVLNIEAEHLDYFKNFNAVKKSFIKFENNSEIVVSSENTISKNRININSCNGYEAKNISYMKHCTKFDVYRFGKRYTRIELKAYGKHNITNALFAIAVALHYNISKQHIKEALRNFSGTKRRFEVIKNKPFIVHDYAHHPAEIKSSIDTMKKITKKKLVVVFQPHTYSRTKKFMENFAQALSEGDEVCIYKTYSAREKFDRQASAYSLFERISKTKKSVQYFSNFKDLNKFISSYDKNCAILILGAGDIEKFAYQLK